MAHSRSSVKITQATFDETVLENEEVFELDPDEALVETVSQFKQQGLDDLDKFVATSHPLSEYGKYERSLRTQFEGWINQLDQYVKPDGRVMLDEAVLTDVCQALSGIRKFCMGRFPDFTSASVSSCMNDDDNEEKERDEVLVENRNIPFLWLFRSSDTIFTLMSLLGGVVDMKTLYYPENNEKGYILLIPDHQHQRVLKETLLTLISILSIHHESEREFKLSLRDQFSAFDRLNTLMLFYDALNQSLSIDTSVSQRVMYIRLLTDIVALASILCRNVERNKVAFVRSTPTISSFHLPNNIKPGGIQILTRALKSTFNFLQSLYPQSQIEQVDVLRKELIRQISEMCILISVLCRFDDFRSDAPGKMDSSYGSNMSSVHDNVLEFSREIAVPILCDIAHFALEHSSDTDEAYPQDFHRLTASILTTARGLAVNDDVVQALVAMGALRIVQIGLDVGLQLKFNDITTGALGLIRNLCGNDEIKTTLCLGTSADPSSSVLPSMLKSMTVYRSIPSIQEHCCGALAAMALRRPANALRIIEQGGPREILTAMRQHPQNILVQRQGALAIRNIVSRLQRKESSTNSALPSDDIFASAGNHEINAREVFLDLGAEKVLREITASHQASVDEAYAALRDLGFTVSMLTYDAEKNAMVKSTVMFGEIKPQFRATYDLS